MSSNMISGGFQMAGNIMGAKAQTGAIGEAIETISRGLSNDEEFRKELDSWTQAYRDSMDEVRIRLASGQPRHVEESQQYRDASQLMARSLAGSGNTRSGVAVQGARDLAAEEASRAFGQDTDLYRLFGNTVSNGNANISSLLGLEDSARAKIGGLQVDKGAVKGAMWQGIGDTLATVNDKEAADVKKMMTMLFSKGMAGGNMPGAEGTQATRSQPFPQSGYSQTGGGGLSGAGVSSGEIGAGGIGAQQQGGGVFGGQGGGGAQWMNMLGGMFGGGSGGGGGGFGG